MNHKNIKAVYILGENRNGTTWLGNTLFLNFDIIVPYHELHFGLIETSLFSLNKIWCDFKTDEEKVKFIQAFSTSDLFLALDGQLDLFVNKKFETFYDFFFDLIENKCKQEHKTTFAIKLEPRFLSNKNELNRFIERSEKRFKEIYFISIQREFKKFYRSSKLLLFKTKTKNKIHKIGFLSTIIVTAKYKYFYKAIHKCFTDKNILHLDFKQFKNNFDQSLQLIGEKISEDVQQKSLERTIKNSSTQNETYKAGLLDQVCITLVMKVPFLDQLIFKCLDFVSSIFGNKSKHTYFRIYRSIHDKDGLIEEFKNSYEEILIDKLNPNSK